MSSARRSRTNPSAGWDGYALATSTEDEPRVIVVNNRPLRIRTVGGVEGASGESHFPYPIL